MYFDTAYVAKFYLDDPESPGIRSTVVEASGISTSVLAFTEFHGVLHRRLREGTLSTALARNLATQFQQHCDDGLWRLLPLPESALRRTARALLHAPSSLFLRTADAIHLQTASDAGEPEIWTNDRHMLKAASYFGLRGRSIRA